MNTSWRRVLLAVTIVLGLDVGLWAEISPASFFTSFPGFGLHWIDVDGAFDEHLIRDVGALDLALTAISIAGLVARTATAGRLAGLGWAVFGVLHVGYHALHPEGAALDVALSLVALGVSAVLGILLLLPPRRAASREPAAAVATEAAR
jgi:hypothetical protein